MSGGFSSTPNFRWGLLDLWLWVSGLNTPRFCEPALPPCVNGETPPLSNRWPRIKQHSVYVTEACVAIGRPKFKTSQTVVSGEGIRFIEDRPYGSVFKSTLETKVGNPPVF